MPERKKSRDGAAAPTPRARAAIAKRARAAAKHTRAAASRAGAAARTLIAVDVGNSEVVVGWFRGATLERFWRLTSSRQTADEIALALRALLRDRLATGPKIGRAHV